MFYVNIINQLFNKNAAEKNNLHFSFLKTSKILNQKTLALLEILFSEFDC